MYNLLYTCPGTRLFHGSQSFAPTQYSLPLQSFPSIVFFSSHEIAQRYGPVEQFVVLVGFNAVLLNDAHNLAMWRRDIPHYDLPMLDSILDTTHLRVEASGPDEKIFHGGLPVRRSESWRDKLVFAKLMDMAGVDAIFVDAQTSMHHPEIAVRFRLSANGPFHAVPPIERFQEAWESWRDAWLSMAARMGNAKVPADVKAPNMSAYVKWLWQWCTQYNVTDQALYLFYPLGLVGAQSLWDFQPPAYDKSMAEVGIDSAGYIKLTHTWSTMMKSGAGSGGVAKTRLDLPILSAANGPTEHLNKPPFQAFLEPVAT